MSGAKTANPRMMDKNQRLTSDNPAAGDTISFLAEVAFWFGAALFAVIIVALIARRQYQHESNLSYWISHYPVTVATVVMIALLLCGLLILEDRYRWVSGAMDDAQEREAFQQSQPPASAASNVVPLIRRPADRPAPGHAKAQAGAVKTDQRRMNSIDREAAELVQRLADAIRPYALQRKPDGSVQPLFRCTVMPPEIGVNEIGIPVRLHDGARHQVLKAIKHEVCARMPAGTRFVERVGDSACCGFLIPRADQAVILLRQHLSRIKPDADVMNFIIGIDDQGQPVEGRLWGQQTIISGEVGSGKSSAAHSVLTGLCSHYTPDELRLVIIDPKFGAEFNFYMGSQYSGGEPMPHLLCPVIDNMRHILKVVTWLVGEMNRRYRLLAQYHCKELPAYRTKTGEDMPFIAIVWDEYVDCKTELSRADSDLIDKMAVSLIQKGRAVGMSLILIAQRADKSAVPEMLRDQAKQRLMLRMPKASAQTLHQGDTPETDKLRGEGDMWLMSELVTGGRIRCQSPFIDDREPPNYPELQAVIDDRINRLAELGYRQNYNTELLRVTGKVLRGDRLGIRYSDNANDPGVATEQPYSEDTTGSPLAIENRYFVKEEDNILYATIVNYLPEIDRVDQWDFRKKFKIGYTRFTKIQRMLFDNGKIDSNNNVIK